MSSLENSVLFLEQVFSRLQSAVSNLASEKQFLYQEIEHRDEALNQMEACRRITLEKLKSMKQALGEEIRMEIPAFSHQGSKSQNRLNILMTEDGE